MQREINQNKKLYLEVIRILAVLLVIFNHTDGFVYYTVPGNIITHLLFPDIGDCLQNGCASVFYGFRDAAS